MTCSATAHPPSQSSLRSADLFAYYRWLCTQPLTVIDVETTGGYASTARVIEISVLQGSLADGIQLQKTDLINPQVEVPNGITRFTGISQKMVDGARLSAQVWPEYLPLLSSGVLTAHNLAFDYGFVQAEYRRSGVNFTRAESDQFCTVLLSRLLLADLPSRSLPDLVQHFGFAVGRSHRAAADTLACWLLAQYLLTELQQMSDERLLNLLFDQWIPLKHAAAILGCLPKQAKTWIEQAKVESCVTDRGRTLYQRGAVELLSEAAIAPSGG